MAREHARGVRIAFAILGVLGLAGALTVALLPLPQPFYEAWCGPGNTSEPAVVALLRPSSIDAGPPPQSTDTNAVAARDAFISSCQSSTDNRMLEALVILVIACFLAFGAPRIVLGIATSSEAPAPGWYPDPDRPDGQRWWDGRHWGPPAP